MKELTGILLCGGKSTRMGTDKALLEFQSQPMVIYPLKVLQQWCSEILISANDSRLDFLGYPVIHDEMINIGPMGGLYACLIQSTHKLNLLFACDMPLITGSLLKRMLHFADNYDAVVPIVNHCAEPLYAFYQKNILTKLKLCIDQGEFSFQKLLTHLNVRYVEIVSDETNELLNMNTFSEIMNHERLAENRIS